MVTADGEEHAAAPLVVVSLCFVVLLAGDWNADAVASSCWKNCPVPSDRIIMMDRFPSFFSLELPFCREKWWGGKQGNMVCMYGMDIEEAGEGLLAKLLFSPPKFLMNGGSSRACARLPALL